MATFEDFIAHALYTGAKMGIEKLSKGKITSEKIDNRVEKRMNQFQKDQDRLRKEIEKKYIHQ